MVVAAYSSNEKGKCVSSEILDVSNEHINGYKFKVWEIEIESPNVKEKSKKL